MKIRTKTSTFLGSSIKIGSAIFVIFGASLIVPKIADAALTLNHMVPKYTIPAARKNPNQNEVTTQNSSNTYEPPNFGHPLSVYGSGTR